MLAGLRSSMMEATMTKKSTVSTKRRTAKRPNQAKTRRDRIATTIATLDELKPPTAKAARAIALLKSWLADESGYDEETLPQLKKALDRERQRVGARRLFDA
jgi:hypothetical protein